MITNFVSQALWISLLVSLPVVGITVVLGFILGFLQAIFQLQDQALPFGIKLVACVACLIMLGPWIAGMMMQYTNQIFEIISMSQDGSRKLGWGKRIQMGFTSSQKDSKSISEPFELF